MQLNNTIPITIFLHLLLASENTYSQKISACFSMSGIEASEFKDKIIFPKTPLFECSVTKAGDTSKINNQKDLVSASGTLNKTQKWHNMVLTEIKTFVSNNKNK